MNRIGLFIALIALLALVMPSLTAQDAKKDAAKGDQKDDSAKEKKKDEAKKPDSKKAPKLVYGSKFVTKILSIGGESNRSFTIEWQELDPQKVFDYNQWYSQRTVQLAQQQAQAKNFQQVASYQQALATFQIDAAKRGNNLTTPKPVEVRGTETATVRSLFPPVEFDELGFQKKWTKKELDERRDKTGLPGFAVDFDALKQGQYVEIYMVKPAPMKKASTKKKIVVPDADPKMTVPEFVLVVIRQDVGK